jgi:hypothetical protein
MGLVYSAAALAFAARWIAPARERPHPSYAAVAA